MSFFRRPEIEHSPAPFTALMDAIETHPVFREASETANAQTQARRAQLGAELAAIERRAQTELVGLANRRRRALDDLNAIEPRYEAAVTAFRKSDQDHESLSAELHHGAERLRAVLAATSHPALRDAKVRLAHEINRLGAVAKTTELDSERRLDGQKVRIFEHNADAIEARRAALRDAITAIDAMEREPDQGAVADRLAELYRSLPSADIMARVKVSP